MHCALERVNNGSQLNSRIRTKWVVEGGVFIRIRISNILLVIEKGSDEIGHCAKTPSMNLSYYLQVLGFRDLDDRVFYSLNRGSRSKSEHLIDGCDDAFFFW